MNEKSEWQFLIDYVKDDTTDFCLDSCRNQLLALWTVYCMHNDLDVDTAMCTAGIFPTSKSTISPAICTSSSASIFKA